MESIDVSAMPELARLAQEVAGTGEAHLLGPVATALAFLSPAPRTPRHRSGRRISESDIEAALATAGGWEGFAAADALKRALKR